MYHHFEGTILKQTPSTVSTLFAEQRREKKKKKNQKTSLTKVLLFSLAEEEEKTLSPYQLHKH